MTASAIPRCGTLGPSGLGVVQVVCELFWIGASVKYLTFTFYMVTNCRICQTGNSRGVKLESCLLLSTLRPTALYCGKLNVMTTLYCGKLNVITTLYCGKLNVITTYYSTVES